MTIHTSEVDQIDLAFENYLVSSNFLANKPDRLVISVSSLGFAPRERFQQFWRLIEENGCDALFVANHTVNWFNNADTDSLFNQLSVIAKRYKHVAIMGESMGASGAILLSNYIGNCNRVLCFAPQFSANSAFMSFDERYHKRVTRIEEHHFSSFSFSSKKKRTLMMFGDRVWQDEVHRAMFERSGFRVLTVPQAEHAVALALRDMGKLEQVVQCFLDFDRDDFVEETDRLIKTLQIIKPEFFQTLRLPRTTRLAKPKNVFGCPGEFGEAIFPNAALQSSRSRYSKGTTPEEDAIRAIYDVNEDFAFHTSHEPDPWWQGEFSDETILGAIRIHNRSDGELVSARFLQFAVSTSLDGNLFEQRFIKLSEIPFSKDSPIVCFLPEPTPCRFVRITSLGAPKVLHLRKIEFFKPSQPHH
ncbi:discoidin domain-containing protein [Bosea sp. (in: a-proteobacteria)]|jgi:hypothetical protein|uniref:discoidin domain-containing protein n=1 Tax=Bosea sp. (in: a-proteobacteria) TaxID=1871050 RepID=UPI001ACE726D|nr:discoidin domain-containing protein [Bosea sp. (in: a-proteobacteria)]MBN9440499.1 discoidin domain-containing protein [Bosea sp. (in: a-proteobacteria)]